ncbi:hypothetical protein L208DRAFT_1276121 [Tricholoma matsutake]|nr:hypothetical protein L208DRAFT_1276121 [Tricholoma matsutake 945]
MVYLDIPSHLSDCSQCSLCHSYAKYKAFLAAVPILDKKWKDHELLYERKPTQEQIIEMMQSKTFWYDYICKYFSCVSAYPEMVLWLEDAEDAPSDLEIWKVEKGQYGFADLDAWLRNDGNGLMLDGLRKEKKSKKGKENERSPVKEKTEKRSHKAKNKGKEKEKEKSPEKAQK